MKTRNDFDNWIRNAYAETSAVFERMRIADDTTWCVWEDQSDDCRKNGDNAFPFKGASDTRVRLVDGKLLTVDAVCNVGYERGSYDFGVGVNGDNVDWASRMNNLMRWQVKQMNPEASVERELAQHWRNRYGFSFMFVSWDYVEVMGKENMPVSKFFRMISYFPDLIDYAIGVGNREDEYQSLLSFQAIAEDAIANRGNGGSENMDDSGEADEIFFSAYNEVMDLFSLLNGYGREKELVNRVKGVFPEMEKEAIRDELERLRVEGEGCFPVPIKLRDQPKWQAMKYLEDVIFPPNTSHLRDSDFIAIRQVMSESEVDSMSDWDDAFKDAVKKTRGSFQYRYKTFRGFSNRVTECDRDEIEVFIVYYYDKDKRGSRALYECVYSPHLPGMDGDLFGKHEIMDLPTPSYPVVEMVFERRESAIVDNEGIPGRIYALQTQIKKERDSRIDSASLQNFPMFERDPRDRDKPIVFGPGKEIGGKPNTFKWLYVQNTGSYQSRDIEEILQVEADRLCGVWSEKVSKEETYMRQECLVNRWLDQMSDVMKLTFRLMQHYLSDDTVVRVVGSLNRPFRVSRQEIQGGFDFQITFDAKELDPDYLKEKQDRMVRMVSLDTQGNMDRSMLLQIAMRSIDPNWADKILVDSQSAANLQIDDEKNNIALIMSGQEPKKVDGQNYQLREKVIMDTLNNSPVVRAAYDGNETIRALFDSRLQHLQFMQQQQENAVIGRYGSGSVIGI